MRQLRKRRTLARVVALTAVSMSAVFVSAGRWTGNDSVYAAANRLQCDFDHDGRGDLAVGVPGDNNGRGAVNVQYSPDGLLGAGAYFRRGLNLPGASTGRERLGSSVACGDFDGDGFADLAIGVPGESTQRGGVVVVYGSAVGLVDNHATSFNQNTIGLGLVAPADPGDRFGETLIAGDFNADGRDDLAIGVPGEDSPAPPATPGGPPGKFIDNIGMVHVVFGSASLGLTGPAQTFSPFTPGVCCFVATTSFYGAALAAGDFNNDGVADLAIGAPLADVDLGGGDGATAPGAVHVVRGEAGTGLVVAGQLYLTESDLTVMHEPRPYELLGWSLAVGQFDGRHGDDLAKGAPFEKLDDDFDDTYVGYGAVRIALFDGAGQVMAHQFFTDVFGDGVGDGERFGWAVAAGNFDGANDDDLAIGVPDNVSALDNNGASGGAVVVVFSDGFALGPQSQSFFPGEVALGVQTPPPPANMKYHFGRTLATGDYQGDGFADLFIGVPSLSLTINGMGAVEIRPGAAGVGLGASYLLLTQDTWQPGKTWEAAQTSFAFTTGLSGKSVTWIGEQMGHALGR